MTVHSWTEQALCAQIDPELFFPQLGDNTSAAKQICRSCPVAEPCLEWALSLPNDEYGIYAGTTVAQRRRIREQRQIGEGGIIRRRAAA